MKLTPYQSTFYNEWILNPFRSDYNIIFDQSMSGYVDIQRLNSSLVRFINNNLLLNSNVVSESENLVWKHRPLLSEDSQVLTFITEEPSSDEILQFALQPFDLEKEQLARFYAIKLNNGGYRIIHIFSHILVDGLSANSIYAELSIFYNDLNYVNPISLSEQEKQYEKLRNQLEDILVKGKTEMSDFWKSSLKEVENIGFKFLQTSDSLLLDSQKRTEDLINPVSELRFNFSEAVFLKVRQLISKYKLTPYTYGQLVFAIVLHRISRVNNLVINYPVGITEGQDFIFGAHINTILKEYRFEAKSSLQDLIHQNIEYTNQLKRTKARYLPIEELISYAPTSNILEFGFVQTSLKDVVIHYEGADNVIINSDLNVDLVGKLSFEQEVRDGQINYKVRYANQKLDNELIGNFVDIYKRLFIEILEDLLEGNADKFISQYKLLNKDSYQSIISSWDTIELDNQNTKTIHQLFEDCALKIPEASALVYQNIKITYSELNERSNRLAHYLINTFELKPDELVPLCLERSENMLIAILAVLKAGAAYVPMDPSYPLDRIEHILKDTRARVVLTEEKTVDRVNGFSVQHLSLNNPNFSIIINSQASTNPVTEVSASNLAYVIYTSGTTGAPKGVMVEHQSVINVVDKIREAYGFAVGEKITAYTSYVFDVSVSEFFNGLLYGNEVHLLDELTKKDADRISKYLLENAISYAYLPPVMLSVLPRVDYPSLKGLLYAGEPCDYETGKYWSEKKILYNLYGPTEATIYASYKQIKYGDVHIIGKPVENSSAYILDMSEQLAPIGAVGELYLGGVGIARGYLNQTKLTEERFIENPFQTKKQKERGINGRLYKTGDLVRWLPDGNIEYIGRNDFQVKIRGYRIELGEIEERLSHHSGIKQAVVLAKENNTGMKYLAGYYVSEGELDAESLTEYLSETLPEYMVPSVFVHLTTLPLTINGKLDRKQLPEPEFSGEREYIGPENELQEKLCKIYSQILGLESTSIGIHDDFFRLGGNSIMAIKLISKIKQELEVSVNVSMVFGHKTVASLSHILDKSNNDSEQIIITTVPVSQPEEQRLSFAQERLWFIESYEGSSSVYNVPMVFKLGGEIYQELLQNTFDLLMQRHEVLRSIILTTEDGLGYQKVTDQRLQIHFGIVDNRSELDQAMDYAANKIFHLDRELPITASVFSWEENYYVSVVIHHIAFDGWSTEIFINEFNTIYQALIEEKEPQLPVLSIQYKDYALWQRNYLSGEILENQTFYWKNKLEGFQTLNLPLDFKRPAHVSYTGATTYFDIPEQLASSLQQLSKDLGVSLYSVMLSGYYLMLSAYSGQDDIIVGSPVANRHHAGLENIIGFFVNTFVLREKINPDQHIKDFIIQVSQAISEAQSHQDLPFEKLVEELGVEQDNSRNPIFQVMFGIQSFEEEVSQGNDSAILLPFDGDIDYKSAKFDLTMMIDVHGDSIRGIFNYAVALFKHETIIRMKETYMLILMQLVEVGNVVSRNNIIKNLHLLTDEEYKSITKTWYETESAYPEGFTIHRLFEDQVAKTPNATALVYRDIRLSYQELNERANRLANHLIDTYDVKPDDLIPICLERSEHMLIAILGVLKAGAAYVPMDPQYPAERIQHILDDTKAKIVLTEETLKSQIEAGHIPIVSLNNPRFQEILDTISLHNPVTRVSPENLSYVIYTSGTTGMPKGVMIEHQNVVNVVSQIRDAYGFSEGEKITAYTSYVFDVSVSEFFNALLYGNELHLLDESLKKDADLISRYLLDHEIAYAYLPPVMLSVLPRIQYPSLKGMLYAGEPCDYETGKYWSEYTELYNLYGPTEATIYATYKKVEHGDVHLIGRPVNNTSAYILDAYYRPIPIGAVGELYLGGNGIARGYLNRPELTSERFVLNPFQSQIQKIRGKNEKIYKTGDLVRLLPNGNIEYIGRNDFQVKIRGYRIELGEIEAKLQEYSGIKQTVVLAKENKTGMKFLVGYYVADEVVDERNLSAFLSETLPEYMIPAVYLHLEALPLTINGKLDRRALPEPEFTGIKKYIAPQTELQEKLCHIYAEVLGLDADGISIHDDFFRLGGNSIMAIKLISRIKNYLDLPIQVTSVFNHKTIASLASFLETEVPEENILIEPVSVFSPEEQRLSFAQERLWFIEAYEGGSSAYNIPMVLTLSPDVQLEKLQQSLEIVIMRHEVLRSVIKMTNEGRGYQVATDSMPEFKLVEIETEEELKAAINSAANKVFHLEGDLPLDITLFRLKEKYYLSLVVHHIAFDGWSVDILLKEMQVVYEALSKEETYKLSDLAIQYKDFALWQRNYLQGEVLNKQINYWKEILVGFESLNLPLDFKRPAHISYEGAAIYFDLSPDVALGLRKISRDLGVSLYSVMLGGYYLMLSAYSGQEDIMVGSPISNRHHAGLEDIIGFFVNTLALRGNVDSNQNLKNYILEIAKSIAEAQSHQDLPFEKLVEELEVEQDMSRHPIFQVMFGVQSFGKDIGKDAVFSLFDGEIDYQAAKFDLTTMIDDGDEKIKGMFNYAVSLFSKDTIVRMKDTYILLLEQIASMGAENAENIKIKDFHFFTDTDHQKVIEDWNSTNSEYPSDKTIQQLFEDQVIRTPNHIALVYQEIKLSYKEVNERSNRLANYLIGRYNIQPDEIIPLCLERSENMLIAILGVLKSGAAYVPIDPSYPSDRISHILKDTYARIIIGQESTAKKLKDHEMEFISLDEVQCKAQLEISDSNNPITQAKAQNLAYVIYTSGTTGLPKGVMVEHRGVANLVTQFAEKLELNSIGDSWKNGLWYANYVFDAHIAELFPFITHGHSIYLLDKEKQTDIVGLQQYISENDIHIATIPPVLLTKDYILPLKKLIVAGDVTNPQLMTLYQSEGIDIINAYGPTEGTVCASLHYYKEDHNPLNIGGPIGNMTCYVLDEHFRAVPIGGIGELYIGGAGIARGYLNKPELTEERFIINPFQTKDQKSKSQNRRLYKTGDLVRWLSNGELEYIGRNDFQVKIRGYRIELGEIENTLLHYSGIRQTAVLAKENKSGLKYLAAYYVSDSEMDSRKLSEYLSAVLPDYMVPAAFIHLTSLPLTINGKLDKKKLPEPGFTANKNYIAPETELQSKLCQIYGDVLGLSPENISIEDDFFRLGGDSIISIQLVGRIRQQFDIRLSVKEVFTARTVSALSLLIEDKKGSEAGHILSEQGVLEGKVSLLPIQEWFFSQKEQGYLLNFNHWNQAFLIHVPELDKELLESAVQQLLIRHDAFRLHYPKVDEVYSQMYGIPDIATLNPSIRYLNASGLSSEDLTKTFTDWQSGFDIEKGPLYEIGYINGYKDGSARLYFALHHLIIDAVSWRIITEDLKNIYQSLEKGQETSSYHTKGSSYRQWVEAVRSYQTSDTESRAQELLYWNATADIISENNETLSRLTGTGYHHGHLILSKEMTGLLIRNTHHAYHTEINDLLISALSLTLYDLTGEENHSVLLESHGREEIFDNLDITETVGWFTTMYPLLLKKGKDLFDTVVLTKESLRRIPNKGIGYGSLIGYTEKALPKVSFNYLGQLDQEDTSDDKSWFITAEDSGSGIGTGNQDSQYISINGAVVDGQLRFEVSGCLSEDQINLVSSQFKNHLESIITCLSEEDKSYLTPSDVNCIIDREQLLSIQEKGEIEGVYLANSLQEGFVYHALNQGDKDDAYRVQLIWDYHSGIDIDHLKHSWKLIQKSYPTLRVRFDWNGEIVQVIDKEGELDWRYYDISNLDNESQEIFIQELTHKDRFEVYDLSKGSLFRVYLFKRGEKYYSCLFSNHHAILDGWSMPVILNSVHNAYMSLANDDIPVVSVDHAYALTQQYLQSYKAGSTSFWNNYMNLLEDHEDLSSLVKEEKRHIDLANHRHILNHQHITMLIEGERYRSLKEFTKEQGFTVNAVLQYLWHKQLSIYSGLKTSVVGTTVSGRSLPVDGIETSAGLYINTLPLIVNHREGKVTDHIMEVQDRISDLNTHSDVNLAELNHDGRRIFSSLFVYENYPIPKGGERNELGFEFRDSVEKLDYPLGVVAYEREGKVSLILNYDGHLFEKEMMAQLILGMETILSQILNSPDIISEAISYLTEDTLQKITEDWNDTWYEFPSDKTIHELFEKQVVKTPDHVALIYQDTKLLYSELNERSNRLAHYLINTYNLQPDELVPLCLERSENMIIAILAVWKAGAAYVPMDPSYPADRIKHILTDTGARVVLAQESTADQVQIIENGNVVSLDSTIFKNAFEEMSPVNPGANINSHNLAYVIYTSGTTGLPKGVMVEHKNVVNLISDLYSRYGLDDKDVILQFANYVFDPSVEQILLAILNGNSLLLTEDKSYLNEETFLKTLNDHNVSYINLTPSVLQNIDITQVKTMRKLASGGEALTIDLYNKLKGEHFNFLNCYGPTEVTVTSIVNNNRRANSIGRPIGNTSVYVLDAQFRPVPIGAVGELYIGGSGVSRGYLNRTDLTDERFILNPFQTTEQQNKNERLYKTGDLVRWLSDGNIEYIGRNDFQVKIRGYRIELEEIENRLLQHPEVRQVAVLAKENTAGMKYLAGYYVADSAVDSRLLSEFLSETLPEYMVPAAFIHLTELPISINGKLDRKRLPEPGFTGMDAYTAPENELQQKLAEIYAEVVGLEASRISIHDDFFRLGGNSIMAIKLISKIKQRLDIRVEVATIFSHKTIASLSYVLKNENHFEDQPVLSPVRVNFPEEQRLSFAQERLWFIETYEGGSSAYNIPMTAILDEKTDILILQKAFEQVIKHHEVLRSVIKTTEDGVGYQVVTDLVPEWKITEVNDREYLDEIIKRFANKIFRLEIEIPIEINILRFENKHYLSVVIHHIAFDG